MTPAFLLSQHWHDDQQQTWLTFWWHTDAGPVRQILAQPSVCFIEQHHQRRAQQIAQTLNWPVEIRPITLHHFNQQPASACYMPSALVRRWRSTLAQESIPCREVDIRPNERYLMERFIYGQAELPLMDMAVNEQNFIEFASSAMRACQDTTWQPQLRCLSIDIETSFPRLGQPDLLFSIGLYADGFQQVLMIGEPSECLPTAVDVRWFADEPALLEGFLEVVNTYNPDALLGWNVVGFDFAFLRKKFKEHQLAFAIGRDGSELEWYQSRSQPEQVFLSIAGRVVLDGISQLRNAAYQFESFTLNAVAEELLDDNKLLQGDDRGGDIEYLFAHDKAQLAAYNLKDCELVWRIFAVTKLLEFSIERSRMTGLLLDKVGGSVSAFENLYLPRLHRAGYVAPSMGEGFFIENSPGGYVLDSRPGLFEHVLVLDFKSLYPSIIRTFCIDPAGLVNGLTTDNPQDTIEDFLGARFHRQQHVLPQLIAELGEKREAAKRAGNKPLSQAIKIIMASCYGVLGAYGCRFADNRLSASITLRGQQIIQQSCDWVHQQGFEVIYGDTDSIFVWLNQDVSDEQADAIGKQLMDGLNQWWQQQYQQQFNLISYLEVEYETHYQKFFMPAIRGEEQGSKKRYAGLVRIGEQTPTVMFKGLEAVRSDWTDLARNFQRELYRRIFLGEPYQQWLRQQVKDLFAGKKDHELIYHKRLGQPLPAYQKNVPPHAQAAIKLEQWRAQQGLSARFNTRGGRINYYQSSHGPEPLTDMLHEPALQAVDYYHYLNKQMRPVAEAIFQFTDDDFDHLAGLQLSLF